MPSPSLPSAPSPLKLAGTPEALLKQQRWSEAIDAFVQALKEREDWPTWLGLGKAYLRSARCGALKGHRL